MSYTKTVWVNNQLPPLNADNLNKIEQGVGDAHDLVNEAAPGLIGPTGDQGPVGDKGPDGDKGVAGDQGPVGDKGPDGDAGTPAVILGQFLSRMLGA